MSLHAFLTINLNNVIDTNLTGITMISDAGGDPMAGGAQKYFDAKLCEYQHAIPDAGAMFDELKEITANALFVGNQRY